MSPAPSPVWRAVWLTSSSRHRIDAPGPLALRTLYFAPGRVGSLPRHCCVVGVPPLLRELIVRLVQRQPGRRPTARRARLEAVALDLLDEGPRSR